MDILIWFLIIFVVLWVGRTIYNIISYFGKFYINAIHYPKRKERAEQEREKDLEEKL
jgi:hypothetical protein|tara:strand:- start:3329 stop:3499 length:171 start_codon:yes stop_codon:yes gene_type:complete